MVVAETGHLGRAATVLHLSQPPLTRQIKALEAKIGAELFTRTPHGMELTQAGEMLLHDARSIFGLVQQARERAQRAASGRAGSIQVGLYGSATFGVVPQVLLAFRASHPDVDVSLHYAQMPHQITALRQGRVLIAFERLLPNEPDIEIELVARERLVLAVNQSHALARRRVVPITALKGVTLRVGTSPSETTVIVELCRKHGFEPHFSWPASDLIMATVLAGIDGDPTLVPESMANVRIPGVKYVDLDASEEGATINLHCFYLRSDKSPMLTAMLDVIREFRSARE